MVASPASAAVFSDYVTLSATSLDFGDDVRFGEPRSTLAYTLTAVQDTTVSTSGWYTPGPSATFGEVGTGACAGINVFNATFTMTTGQVCTITVTFDPNQFLAPVGSIQGGRTWTATGAAGPATQPQINYTALVHALDWTPRSLSFAAAPGQTSEPQAVTFTNRAVVPLSALDIGGYPVAFARDPGTCGSPLPVGGTCTTTYTYTGDDASPSVSANAWVHFSATGPAGPKTYTYDTTAVRLYGWTPAPIRYADIAVTKQAVGSDPITAGSMLAWDVTVADLGPDDAPAVRIVDTLPTGTAFVAGPPECEAVGASVTCELGDLTPGIAWTADVVTSVDDPALVGRELTNAATITTTAVDPHPANDATAAVSPTVVGPFVRTDLAAGLVPDGPTVELGAQLGYDVTVANAGTVTLDGVTATSPVPDGTTFLSAGGSAGGGAAVIDLAARCPEADGTITCDVGTVAPGDTVVIPVSVRVGADVAPGTVLDLSATVAASEPDADLAATGSDGTATALLASLLFVAGLATLVARRAAASR